MSRAKRVLVTGASGFIGRWSVPALLDRDFEVHAVAGSQRDVPAELSGATVHHVNLLDERASDALLRRVAPSHLLHFAWIATPGLYWESPENARWLTASRHLLRAFRDCGGVRAVMAGSCVEYDWSKVEVCDERASPLADSGATPPSAYAVHKIAMQRELAEFGFDAHLSTAWGRIFFQFGPYEHPDRLVPFVIRHLLRGEEALCTHGRQVRSFMHVSDVGSAFAGLLAGDVQGPVNVGSDEQIAVAQLIERIARDIGRPDLVRLGARIAPTAEPALLVPDVRRLRDEVGWRPALTLSEGLDDCIGWWREHVSHRDRGSP